MKYDAENDLVPEQRDCDGKCKANPDYDRKYKVN